MRYQKVIFLLLVALTLSTSGARAQSISTSASSAMHLVTPAMRRDLLRHPNGIENLSALTGDVSFQATDERWSSYEFDSLAKQSSMIVTAYVTKKESFLSEDGDSINTDCTLNILRTIKGTPVAQILLDVRGGSLKLPTGHIATVRTQTWETLQTGKTVILFLEQNQGKYRLVGNVQGILQVTDDTRQVHLADTDTRFGQTTRKELEGATLASAEDAIRIKSLQQP